MDQRAALAISIVITQKLSRVWRCGCDEPRTRAAVHAALATFQSFLSCPFPHLRFVSVDVICLFLIYWPPWQPSLFNGGEPVARTTAKGLARKVLPPSSTNLSTTQPLLQLLIFLSTRYFLFYFCLYSLSTVLAAVGQIKRTLWAIKKEKKKKKERRGKKKHKKNRRKNIPQKKRVL